MGAAFLKLLQGSEEFFKRLSHPIYVRLALGGLVVGVIAVCVSRGVGQRLRDHQPHSARRLSWPTAPTRLLFLVGLFLAKLVATLATVGSGAVGGVFTPTLFLGAGLGALSAWPCTN